MRTASCFKPRAALKTPDKNGDAEAAQTKGKKDATPTSSSESLKGLSLAPVIAGYDGHRSPLMYL